MIYIVHVLGFLFAWPLFILTVGAHATWAFTKFTFRVCWLPFKLTLRLFKRETA